MPSRTAGNAENTVWAEQGWRGRRARLAAAQNGIAWEAVKLAQAQKGWVLLSRGGAGERSLG